MNPMQALGAMQARSPMGNNPILWLMDLKRRGANPNQILQQMIQQNPQMQQYMPLVQGKDGRQLEETFRNLCNERGIDADTLLRQLGMK